MRHLLAILLIGGIPLVAGCGMYLVPPPLWHMHKECDAIEGSVVDGSTGTPVKAATVWVHNHTYDEAYKTQTDSDGRFRVGEHHSLVPFYPFVDQSPDRPPTLDILIEAQGYQATTYKGVVLTGTQTRSRRTAESSQAEPVTGTFSWGTWRFTPARLVPEEPPPP